MKSKLTFEEAIKELEEIVNKMEHGEMTLDQSLDYFRRGVELSHFCSKRLDEVEQKITLLVEDENGDIKEEDFNVELGVK